MKHHGSVIGPSNSSFFTPINKNRVSKQKLLINNRNSVELPEKILSPNIQNRKYMSPTNIGGGNLVLNDLTIDSNVDLNDVYKNDLTTLNSIGSTRNNTTLFGDKSN